MLRIDSRIPIRTIILLLICWIALGLLNLAFKYLGLYEDVPNYFPISVFTGIRLHLSGIPYLLCFMAILGLATIWHQRLRLHQIWLIGLALIILANLGQGDWDSAFHKPFYESGIQYYHDAIKIQSWLKWLASFNDSQPNLLIHTRTHPPFAVLVHYWLLCLSEGSLPFLAITFVAISSLSIILVWQMFNCLGVARDRCNLIAVLFSVIPAVNIYGGVSLDGIVLTTSTLFLYAIVLHHSSHPRSWLEIPFLIAGFTLTNLLTFGGIFLALVAGILALRELILNRRLSLFINLAVTLGTFLILVGAMSHLLGYSHLEAFLTASALENPQGFQGFHKPLEYLATRVECICEIMLFLSFGLLAMLFHPRRLGFSWSDWYRTDVGIMLSGIVALLAILASGAYRTGETARGAIFIYPYLALALTQADSRILKSLIGLAGFQTLMMQLLGGYFW